MAGRHTLAVALLGALLPYCLVDAVTEDGYSNIGGSPALAAAYYIDGGDNTLQRSSPQAVNVPALAEEGEEEEEEDSQDVGSTPSSVVDMSSEAVAPTEFLAPRTDATELSTPADAEDLAPAQAMPQEAMTLLPSPAPSPASGNQELMMALPPQQLQPAVMTHQQPAADLAMSPAVLREAGAPRANEFGRDVYAASPRLRRRSAVHSEKKKMWSAERKKAAFTAFGRRLGSAGKSRSRLIIDQNESTLGVYDMFMNASMSMGILLGLSLVVCLMKLGIFVP